MLLKHLVLIARAQGLPRLEADVLAQNRAMLRVFERSGMPMELGRDSNVVHICLRLA
jgi:RimJ/RimL family protein N-acetyltransferase